MSTRSFSVATSAPWAAIVPSRRSRSARFCSSWAVRLPRWRELREVRASTRSWRVSMAGDVGRPGDGDRGRARRDATPPRRSGAAPPPARRDRWRSSAPRRLAVRPRRASRARRPPAHGRRSATASTRTLPVSSGWIVLMRPTGWILPCATAMMSTRPNQDQASAATDEGADGHDHAPCASARAASRGSPARPAGTRGRRGRRRTPGAAGPAGLRRSPWLAGSCSCRPARSGAPRACGRDLSGAPSSSSCVPDLDDPAVLHADDPVAGRARPPAGAR